MKKLFVFLFSTSTLTLFGFPLKQLEVPPGTTDGQVLTYFGPANTWFPKNAGGGSNIWTNNNGNNVTLFGDSGFPFVAPTINVGYPLSIVPLEQFRVRNQNVGITYSTYWEFGNQGNSTECIVGEATTTGTNGSSANAVLGYADGNFTNQTAVSGLTDVQINGGTNVAGFFSTFEEGNTGQFVGLFAEVYETGWSADPVIENGVLVLDARGANVPLIVGRTNNGTHVFGVDKNGVVTATKIASQGTTTNFTTYASGTAYTLTGSFAALTFGTTQPVLTINQAGTYLIQGNVGIKYSGATYAGAQTITLKLRRTNNTAADLSNGSRVVELPVLTTFTGGDVMAMPPVVYTATAGDTITIFGVLSATPAAGSVLADSAELVAIRLY